jgi:TPR repeat protein
MKAGRLIFTLLLAWSVAVVQLAAQQSKADQKPIEEVKAKADAGDARSQVELGRLYNKGEGVVKDQVEAAKWFRKAGRMSTMPGSCGQPIRNESRICSRNSGDCCFSMTAKFATVSPIILQL